MQPVDATTKLLRQKMQKAMFDVSPDGVLIYQDPMIGRLANKRKQLAVIANPTKARLELEVHGKIEKVFAFGKRIDQACREAFHAYFEMFESLCANRPQVVRAA